MTKPDVILDHAWFKFDSLRDRKAEILCVQEWMHRHCRYRVISAENMHRRRNRAIPPNDGPSAYATSIKATI
jgi:hypothetical protein